MSNEIVRISNIAKQFQKVDSVMYALNKENLKINAIRIAGNRAVGIDQVTKREYIANLDENLDNLILRMKKMAYKPKAVKRVYIPKPGSDKKRPLGIPAFEDKIVQAGMTQILNAIYEPMFKEFSFGFRPERSCHQAIAYFVLDEWFDKIIKRQTEGYAGIVRYADDSVACFEHRDEAEKYLRSVKERLKRFGLEISEEKTKIIEFGRFAVNNRKVRKERKPETFDFLGFTHYCSKSRKRIL